MAQSVKLKDGSYIDTEGIYDVTQGKTQADINLSIIYSTDAAQSEYVFTTDKPRFWILGRFFILSELGVSGTWELVNKVSSAQFAISKSGNTYTLTISGTTSAGGILVIG